MTQPYITKNADETKKLAQELLETILNKKFVLLNGPLGSGKTTFAQGLAKALGVEEIIKSPTYTYLNSYTIPSSLNHNLSTLNHFDLYRLPEQSTHPEQTSAEIGLEEALHNPDNLVIIEWAERLPIKQDSLSISFVKKDDYHQISIK